MQDIFREKQAAREDANNMCEENVDQQNTNEADTHSIPINTNPQDIDGIAPVDAEFDVQEEP